MFEPAFPFQKKFGGRRSGGKFGRFEDQMMSQETATFREIVAGIDNAREDVKFRAANVEDAMGANDRVVIWFGSVVTEFFDARDERVTQIAAARDGAVAGLAGNQPPGHARIDQLPRHITSWVARECPARFGKGSRAAGCPP